MDSAEIAKIKINFLSDKAKRMKIRVGSRVTIVIPKEVRERSGVEEGDLLEVSVKEEAIVLVKNTTWERFHGCAKGLTNVEKVEKELDEDEKDREKRLER